MDSYTWNDFLDRLLDEFGIPPDDIEAALRAAATDEMPDEDVELCVLLLRQKVAERAARLQ